MPLFYYTKENEILLAPTEHKFHHQIHIKWTGLLSRYSGWLRAGWFGDRISVGARFSAPVQTGPGAQPASYTMGTGYFRGVKSGRGMKVTPHPLLVPWSRKGRAIPQVPYGPYGLYRASVPVQGCTLTLPFIHIKPKLRPPLLMLSKQDMSTNDAQIQQYINK